MSTAQDSDIEKALEDGLGDVSEINVNLDVVDEDGNKVDLVAEELNTGSLTNTDIALITYVTRALQDIGLDEIRSRIHDSSGTQIDPVTQALENALKTNDTDEIIVRVTGADGSEIADDPLDTAVSVSDDQSLLTYVARALNSIGQDELVSRVTDSSGTQIDPLDESSIGPLEQSTATAAPGQIDLGEYITDIDVFLDLSAVNNDYVFEVSQGGSNWREHTRVAQANLSTGGEFFQFDTSFQFARSRYLGSDSDVSTHETSAKGVS